MSWEIKSFIQVCKLSRYWSFIFTYIRCSLETRARINSLTDLVEAHVTTRSRANAHTQNSIIDVGVLHFMSTTSAINNISTIDVNVLHLTLYYVQDEFRASPTIHFLWFYIYRVTNFLCLSYKIGMRTFTTNLSKIFTHNFWQV